MPIHTSAFTSRHKLDHPDEKDPPTPESLAYERVLKYNPNHDSTGRFTSGGGGSLAGSRAQYQQRVADKARHPGVAALAGARANYQKRIAERRATLDPNFHHGVGDAEMAGYTPYTHAVNPAKISFSSSQRRAHAKQTLGRYRLS